MKIIKTLKKKKYSNHWPDVCEIENISVSLQSVKWNLNAFDADKRREEKTKEGQNAMSGSWFWTAL